MRTYEFLHAATPGLAGAVFGLVLLTSPAGSQPPPAEPSWFTEEQAAIGETAYLRACEACHGDELVGGVGGGPPLTGDFFYGLWGGAPLDGLFLFIKETMPQDRPGSLSNGQVANIMAYILKFNGLPAGDEPLPADASALSSMTLERP